MKQGYVVSTYVLIFATGAATIAAESTLSVSVQSGPAYAHKVKFGLISMSVTPQMAIWIETADGRYIDTVYVTKNAGTAAWTAAGGSRRPESLPVWSHARGVAASDGLYMPDKTHRLPDAVSGATPKAASTKAWKVPASLSPGTYRIRVELNSSFDWNEAYPDKLPASDPRWSAVNGQPSIIWECKLELGGSASSADLQAIGRGSLRGESGAVSPGLEGITSAKELASSIRAEYLP
jgi:hypothetical protein